MSVFDTRNHNAALPAIELYDNLPEDIAIDATGKLYIADFGEDGISVFYGEIPSIYAPYQDTAVKTDPSGRLYVGAFDQPPGPNQKLDVDVIYPAFGNALLSKISTGLGYLSFMAVD